MTESGTGGRPSKTSAKKASAKKATTAKKSAKKSPAKKTAKKTPAGKASTPRSGPVSDRTRRSATSAARSAPRSKFFTRARARAESIVRDPDKLSQLTERTSAMAGSRSEALTEVLDDLTTMIRLVRAYARGDYREIPLDNLVLIVAALVYVVSPLDFIPDVIPGLGFTDDVAVVVWVVKKIRDELPAFRAWEDA